MKPRPIRVTSEGGRALAYVPISRGGVKEACLYLDDYQYLVGLGVSANWQTSGRAVIASSTGGRILVGRTLVDAKAGQQVRYHDGNPLNLRRDNLYIKQGGFSIKSDLEQVSVSTQ